MAGPNFMHDVVHIDRSKLHTLESLSSAKFRKSLLKTFASQKHAASDVANMSDLESDDDDESDGVVLVPKNVMRSKTNKSINRLFGKCDRSESDDDDDDDDDDAVAAAAGGCEKPSAKIRRVDSSSLSSLNSMDSTKTKVSRSKHMRAVLGYSDDDDNDDDKDEASASSFRPLQRRSMPSGKRKAPALQTSSTKRKKNSGRDNIVVDIMYNNSNGGGQGVGTARLGRAPKVSCAAVVDA